MGLVWSISVYFVVWWTVLFAVLPWGVTSHHEAGLDVPGGGEPASPVDPQIKRKAITTTWISAVVFAVIWCAYTFHWVRLPDLPR